MPDNMSKKIVRCFLGCGAGVIIAICPLLVFDLHHFLRTEIWIIASIFIGSYSCLFILTERFYYRICKLPKIFQYGFLFLLLAIMEIEFFLLPTDFALGKLNENLFLPVILLLVVLIASVVSGRILFNIKTLVINQLDL